MIGYQSNWKFGINEWKFSFDLLLNSIFPVNILMQIAAFIASFTQGEGR